MEQLAPQVSKVRIYHTAIVPVLLYGWLSKLWSLFGFLISYGYPKRDPNFDNHPYGIDALTLTDKLLKKIEGQYSSFSGAVLTVLV